MKTLDDIIPPSRRAQMNEPMQMDTERPVPRSAGGSRRGFPWGTAIVALVIIALAGAALLYFSKAEVDVTPNVASVPAAGSYSADATSGLSFQVVSATKTESQSVAATGTKQVSTSASGTITVYNEQTTAQKLITNTRFAATTGQVYRIHAAITIPAAKGSTPGSVSATVYADQPGSTYNIGPSSFTLPALSGTAQYSQIYAKSTGSMSGGASGTVPVVDPATESAAVSALQDTLAPELATALNAAVPAGYLLLPGASNATYAEQAVAAGSNSQAQVSVAGTITAVVFPSTDLAKAIASAGLGANYDGENYTLQNPSSLTLTPTGALPASGDQSFAFSLGGTANLVSAIDPTRIAAAVAGKSRDAAQVALTSFPEVKSAVLILRPFWKTSFPEDPASVKVVVESASAN